MFEDVHQSAKPEADLKVRFPINLYGDISKTKKLALDIGGSLVKLVYLVEEAPEEGAKKNSKPKYQMRFIKFETKYIESCLDFIQKHCMSSSKSIRGDAVHATGGGAEKYRELLSRKLGIKIVKEDEIECVTKGSIYLMQHLKNECYKYDKDSFPHCFFHEQEDRSDYPFLLANIGSGISFIKVNSSDNYERVGGTSIGGGTFWGLGSLLTDVSDFEQLLELADSGVTENVDMLVEDIYGGDYNLLDLPKNLIASSFGKCLRTWQEKAIYRRDHFSKPDVMRGLLKMICNNLGHLAVLYARLHGISKIYFGGYFTRCGFLHVHFITEVVKYYSKGSITALFFKHDGFLGSVGAFNIGIQKSGSLFGRPNDGADSTKTCERQEGIFVENIATTTYDNYFVTQNRRDFNIVSLDYSNVSTGKFPLSIATKNREFDFSVFKAYLKYMRDGIDLFVAELSSHYSNDSEKCDQMCAKYAAMFRKRLNYIGEDRPQENLGSVNDVWAIRDFFIREFIMNDPFLTFKFNQNSLAIETFESFLKELALLPDHMSRHLLIFDHLFAGNMIDLSSSEFLRFKLEHPELQFDHCLKAVTTTTRHISGATMGDWVERFYSGRWKKVLIFVDNSGFDIVNGVFGLVCEFLERGCSVVLAANTHPSFNDVVASELNLISSRLKWVAPPLKKFGSQLKFLETGSGSIYLDFNSIAVGLCAESEDVDLVIIEGQSRCFLGNYHTQFTCDSVSIGTITSSVQSQGQPHFRLFDTFIDFNFK